MVDPPKPPTQLYTVIVVSDHSQAVRRFRLPRRLLERAAWAAGGAGLLGLLGVAHYFSLLGSASENRVLREENAQLRSQVLLVQEKVAHMSATLERVEGYDARLRSAVSHLQDPEKGQAAGPGEPGGAPPAGAGAPGALAGSGGAAAPDANAELHAWLEGGRPLLAAAPGGWPARGWITSEFGVRVDPQSAETAMHRGLDIATPHGAPVRAPSEGTVAFVGVEGSYGKVLVLDHGHGVRTRYGHLSETFVSPGERVASGAHIAAVGNTGRSTGPHLHYEVIVNGVPENPRRFLAE
ncbi:MAG TPA: peptidoglycan DD-metalloendopeptidase family protein [Anaeromyxobacteraceae bacterium]|jgi:murein DD-endopeptidase MepM/ murein hydrolase activator NlpD